MQFGEIDFKVVERVMAALSDGMRKAETESSDGRKVTGYYVTDKQVRIDIVEESK